MMIIIDAVKNPKICVNNTQNSDNLLFLQIGIVKWGITPCNES